MTIYPDAINVVKAQRRISEFTTPDEFASRNSRNGRVKVSSRRGSRGEEIWVVMDVARDGRKLLFWQNDKYESKVIFAARYRLIYIWHRTITRRGFRTLDGRFITPRIATGTVRVRGRSDNYSALDAARIMTRPRVSSVVKFFMAIAQQLIPARLLLLLLLL